MRTPPDGLDDAQLALLLAEAWQFPVVDLWYAPVGFGSHHWVATDAAGACRFVTVDEFDQHGPSGAEAGMNRMRPALLAAFTLREAARLSFVVAPLPAADGAVILPLAVGYAAAVFPFVDGEPYPEYELSTSHDREAVLEVVTALHAATSTVQTVADIDSLQLSDRAHLERALGRLRVPWTGGPFAEPTRDLLASAAAEIQALFAEYDRLAESARQGDADWVITHGEPKADNFLATDAGPMLVDWDTALLAPAARDVWMLDGGSGTERALYTELTGRLISDDDLTFFRLRWDLADIASFVRLFAAPHTRTADTDIAWEALTETLRLEQRWSELL